MNLLTEEVRRASAFVDDVFAQVARVVVGQRDMVERVLIGLLTSGHCLIEGVPGLAKTLLVKTLSQTIAATFQRIQFTPDLLPADITGTIIYNMHTGLFTQKRGPLFANLVLADEVNRAPAKVQSALLEAMQERQVTIGDTTHALPDPFLVLATQNPIEQEGTYPLPEAQVDRFLIKLKMGYPAPLDEKRMLGTYDRPPPPVRAVVGPNDVLDMQALAQEVFVAEELLDYVLGLVAFTRSHPKVYLGASPRAGLALVHASKGLALLRGRDYVLPDDVRHLAPLVLGHRILMSPEAELEGAAGTGVITEAVDKVGYKMPRGAGR
ncbi:MAG: AAA family ATPase [bacterium]